MLTRLVSPLAVASLIASAKLPTPTTCAPGEHSVRAHHRRAYVRVDGTRVKATNVRAQCRKNQRGFDYWNPRIKPGFPEGWLRHDEKSKLWSEEEKERVLEALESIPEFLREKIEGIYRMARDESGSANPGSQDGGKIVLYDSAFEGKYILAHVLAHEMAHSIFERYTPDQVVEYARAGDWVGTEMLGKVLYSRGRERNTFVRDVGWSRFDEDFSSNVEFYMFKPDELKKKTPKVYEWIKKTYGDTLKIQREFSQ